VKEELAVLGIEAHGVWWQQIDGEIWREPQDALAVTRRRAVPGGARHEISARARAAIAIDPDNSTFAAADRRRSQPAIPTCVLQPTDHSSSSQGKLPRAARPLPADVDPGPAVPARAAASATAAAASATNNADTASASAPGYGASAASAAPGHSTSATTAAATASGRYFFVGQTDVVFPVEHMERPEADVGDFLFVENDEGVRIIARRRDIRRGRSG